ALAKNRAGAVCRKNLGAQDIGRHIAHAACGAMRQQITEAHVKCVAGPDVPDVEAEQVPLSNCRARLRDHELRTGDRHRWRDTTLTGKGLVKNAADEPAKVPLSRINELFPDGVRGRIEEHDRDLDHELLPGGDNWEVGESELTADVRKRVRNRVAVKPMDRVA